MTQSFWLIGSLLRWALTLTGKLLSPTKAAHTPLFAATSLEVRAAKGKYAGVYLTPFGVITELAKYATDMDAARELWEASEKVVSEM